MSIGYLDPLDKHKNDPFPYYAQVRTHCPVDYNPILGAYIVTRHKDILATLGNTDTFSSSVALPRNDQCNPYEVLEVLGPALQGASGVRMVVADPPDHAELKRVGMYLFRRDRINSALPRIRDAGAALLAGFRDTGCVELVGQFADPFVYNSLCDFLGVPKGDRERVRKWADQTIVLMDATAPIEAKMAAAMSMHEWIGYVSGLVSMKTVEPGVDVVSEMIVLGLPTDDIRRYLEGVLNAGIYTTRDLIASSVLTLLQPENQGYWQTVGKQPELVPAIIEECMRRDAPHKGLSRLVTQGTVLSGITIPRGSIVMPLIGSANRDEEIFPDPDVFDPFRKNVNLHLALGRGIHFCMGAYLARCEAAVALRMLVAAFPDARLAEGFEPEYFPSPFFRGLTELRLTW